MDFMATQDLVDWMNAVTDALNELCNTSQVARLGPNPVPHVCLDDGGNIGIAEETSY